MTWSFSTSLAATRDKVRFYAGDTDTADQLVVDETIDALLLVETDALRCAALVCRHLAAKYARFADTTNGALAISGAADRSKAFADRAEELEQQADQATAYNAVPRIGGITESQADRIDADTDVVAPRFSRGMFRNPRGA